MLFKKKIYLDINQFIISLVLHFDVDADDGYQHNFESFALTLLLNY